MSNDLPLIRASAMPPRQLSQLLAGIAPCPQELEIVGICDDSRRIQPGEALLCLPRSLNKIGSYLDMAKGNGAVAALAVGLPPMSGAPLPLIALPDMGAAGRVLRRWFGTEKGTTKLIGVTGTDGKTSIAWMLRQALERQLGSAWSMGTLGWVLGSGSIVDLGNTTPSLLNMHRLLAAAQRQRIPAIAAEISSHGIEQGRIAGLTIDAAIWTNLGRDHLEDHGGFDNYARLKRSYIVDSAGRGAIAIANADNAGVRDQLAGVPGILWYGQGLYRSDLAIGWEQELPGMLRLAVGGEEILIDDIPPGDFHAENLAAVALVLLHSFEVAPRRLPTLLAGISAPPGRLERVGIGPWQIFVDYAHTPEALERCLTTARRLTTGRLHILFGCGGDRDQGKRPIMGEIASRLADEVWLTSDNPRSELPQSIVAQIAAGVPAAAGYRIHRQLDRQAAIAAAVATLQPGDTLLIAGKGHEPYMEVAGNRLPWSDTNEAREAVRRRLEQQP